MGTLFGLPGMLWWGSAVAVPILIHLFARQRFRRVEWAAMEFLLRAYKKIRKRVRLEQLLLLLLRILAILLLVMALADPRLDSGPSSRTTDGQRNVILVFDDSLSMGVKAADGNTPFLRAREQALSLIRSLRRDRRDIVTLITASKPAMLRLKGIEELDRAEAELERLELSDGVTDLPNAFRAVDAALEDLPKGADVYLLTDLQRTAFVPALGDDAPPAEEVARPQEILSSLFQQVRAKDARITVIGAAVGGTENVAITHVESTSKSIVADVPTTISVTVHNFGDRTQGGTIQLFVDEGSTPVATETLDILPPRAADVRDFRHTFKTPGAHYVQARFVTDQLEADNHRALVIDVRERIEVLIVDDQKDAEAGEEGAFFFEQALAPASDSDGSRPGEFALEIVDETGLERADLSRKDLVVLVDVALITKRSAEALEAFVRDGGGVLVYAGPRTRPDTMNDLLYREGRGVLPARLGEVIGVDRYDDVAFTLNVADFERPPFVWFSDPRLRPFLTGAPFYRFLRATVDAADASTRVLGFFHRAKAGLSEPSPAFIERTMGNGRCLLVTTTANQEWNDLPVIHLSYVPLVHEMVYHLVRRAADIDNLLVGSASNEVLKEFVPEVVVSRDGQQLKVLRPLPRPEGSEGFELTLDEATLARAGVYRLTYGGRVDGTPRTRYLAVNIDTSESPLERVDRDFLLASFPGAELQVVNDLAAEKAEGRNQREDVWWWIALAAGLVLLIETALSQLFARRKADA